MIYLTMTKADDRYILLSDEKGILLATESPVEAIRNIEDGYNGAFARGYEGSMSAAINFVFFQHSVVAFKNKKEIESIVKHPVQLITMGNVSGQVQGLECDPKLAKPYFEKGDKPRLLPN